MIFFFSIFSHKSLDSFIPNRRSQPGKSYLPSIPKELEVMDNFNPDEPIPQSHNVITLWDLRTALHFDIRTLVFVMRTSIVRIWKTLSHIPSARLTLHFTKLCTKFKIFRKKRFFVTKVTSDTFLSIF
jgi:hypothetical protein